MCVVEADIDAELVKSTAWFILRVQNRQHGKEATFALCDNVVLQLLLNRGLVDDGLSTGCRAIHGGRSADDK